MSGKSRHGHRKPHRSKRKRGMPISRTMPVQQPEVAQPDEPVAPPRVTAHPARMPTSASVRYPYVVTELRRIGILAGIVLVILVVLFLVLP